MAKQFPLTEVLSQLNIFLLLQVI